MGEKYKILLEDKIKEGKNPVRYISSRLVSYYYILKESYSLKVLYKVRWCETSKAKYGKETDSKQVQWWKDENNLEMGMKKCWN